MAITCYTGLPGSGKTYEVVAFVILPAFKSGRRIVTNISGINEQSFIEYCLNEGLPQSSLGSVLSVPTDVLCSDSSFPDLRDESVTADNSTCLIQAGDLLVVDECALVWSTSHKISPLVSAFWRKHRHFTASGSGLACDIVVISQAAADLHRDLKLVVEISFRAKKLTTVGRPDYYSVAMWEGYKQVRRDVLRTETRSYKKDIFPLYKSYSMGSDAASEVSVDKRRNVLGRRSFFVKIIVALVLSSGSLFFLYRVFHPVKHGSGSVSSPSVSSSAPLSSSGSVPVPRSSPKFSQTWRVSGFFSVGSRRVVVLVDGSSHVRYADPSQFTWDAGSPSVGLVDGERVTAFSGSAPDAAPSFPSVLGGSVK
ncbi:MULTISPECIES: zonular occludens toxin domain-containing protein [Asaia]